MNESPLRRARRSPYSGSKPTSNRRRAIKTPISQPSSTNSTDNHRSDRQWHNLESFPRKKADRTRRQLWKTHGHNRRSPATADATSEAAPSGPTSSLDVEASDNDILLPLGGAAIRRSQRDNNDVWNLDADSCSDGSQSLKPKTCAIDHAHCCFCDPTNCGSESKCFQVQFLAEHIVRRCQHNKNRWRLRFAMVDVIKLTADELRRRRLQLTEELEALDLVAQMTLKQKLDFVDQFGELGDVVGHDGAL